MDTDNFVYKIEREDFCKYIAKVDETKFDTNGYLKDNSTVLSIERNKKVIRMIKVKLVEQL